MSKWCASAIAAFFLLSAPSSALSGELEEAYLAQRRGDYATAMEKLRALAERGDADAQLSLGLMFVKGQGGPPDLDIAQTWFKRAAENPTASRETRDDAIYNRGFIAKKLTERVKARDTVVEDAKRLQECKAKMAVAEKLGVFTGFRVEGSQGILVAGRTFFDLPIEAKSNAVDAARCVILEGAEGYIPLVVTHWQTGKKIGEWSVLGKFTMD
jgi:TPR repeat protein